MPVSPPVPSRPSPSPPPLLPPLPPLPPDVTYVYAVTMESAVAGDVSTFNQTAYKLGLVLLLLEQSIDVSPDAIALPVQAASVKVTAQN